MLLDAAPAQRTRLYREMTSALCWLSKGFDLLVYAVAVATVAGSLLLLLTDYDEASIVTPLLIANAVIFAPVLYILLWNAIRKRSFSPALSGLKIVLIAFLISPIPYLAVLYGIKVPDTLKNILLGITALSPIYTSFGYMVASLIRDCMICDKTGCDL